MPGVVLSLCYNIWRPYLTYLYLYTNHSLRPRFAYNIIIFLADTIHVIHFLVCPLAPNRTRRHPALNSSESPRATVYCRRIYYVGFQQQFHTPKFDDKINKTLLNMNLKY